MRASVSCDFDEVRIGSKSEIKAATTSSDGHESRRWRETAHGTRYAGIIVSMGGQTALNVGIELWRNEDLQRRGIRVLGTKIDAIVATEDREIFSTKLREINETLALSYPATTVEGALEAAHKIGYPVLVRAAFTLGGLGSGFAENDAELRDLAV